MSWTQRSRLDGHRSNWDLYRILAVLFAPARKGGHARMALRGHEPDIALPCRRPRDPQPLAGGRNGGGWLRAGVDWAFRCREKPARDLSLSALVAHLRLSPVLDLADRPPSRRVSKGRSAARSSYVTLRKIT